MNGFPLSLWDLLPAGLRPRRASLREVCGGDGVVLPGNGGVSASPVKARPTRTGPRSAQRPKAADVIALRRPSMKARYDGLVEEMKAEYGLKIRKWRKSMSGRAWEVHYRDGSRTRVIEAPYPSGPMSCAVFLHEVGHHAIGGIGAFSPRCLEEYHAWMWALKAMRQRGLNITPNVERRVALSLQYAVRKAKRRGIKAVPEELSRYC